MMFARRVPANTILTRCVIAQQQHTARRTLSSSVTNKNVHLIQPTIGPFVALEHPLATELEEPFAGLCVLTFLQSGSMIHKDSTSSTKKELLLESQEVSWLVSGKGAVVQNYSAAHDDTAEGWKLLVALPKNYEATMEPIHYHSPSIVELPNPRFDTEVRLLVGKLWGREQHNIPLLTGMKDLFVLTIEFKTNASFWTSPQNSFGKDIQVGIYVTSGKIQVSDAENNETKLLRTGEFLIWNNDQPLDLQGVVPDSNCIIFGGLPLPEPRHLNENVCSSDPAKLNQTVETPKGI